MCKIKILNRFYPYLFAGSLLLAACGDENVTSPGTGAEEPGNGTETGNDNRPDLTGYAAPTGVLILSGGTYTLENAFLTFVNAEGEVENKVYAGANGADLGNDGVGLYLCNGKQYILCNDWRTAEGKDNNGLLIIADAETLQKEKSFPRKDMVFQHPVNDKMEEVDAGLSGIVVLDEENIFICAQGVLRFNSLTGELKLIEGAYDIGNAGSANTVESTVSSRGATVYNGNLYAATGGFWTTTALVEFVKGKDGVNRRLELGRGDLVSGMCLMDDGILVVGTYSRGSNNGYLSFVDLDSWTVTDQKTIAANISPALHDNSGITYLNGYIYFTGANESEFSMASRTTLSRYSIETGRVEREILDFKSDEPDANLLDCNVVADPRSGYLYVPTAKENWEGVISDTHILVYDCNGDTPTLVRDISNVAHSVRGIYPLSVFNAQP